MITHFKRYLFRLGSKNATGVDYLIFSIFLFLLYGFKALHFDDFYQIYGQPFRKLTLDRQWTQTGPINNFLGSILSSFVEVAWSYIFVHLLSLVAICFSVLMWKKRLADFSYQVLLSLFFISPLALVPLMWWGKTDGFLIASIVAIAALKRHEYIFLLFWSVLGVFSHPQSFGIQVFGLFILGLISLNRAGLILLFSLPCYFLYIYLMGGLEGRLDYIIAHKFEIYSNIKYNPIIAILSLFGFLWFFIYKLRFSWTPAVYFYLTLCLTVSAMTLDTTRVFSLLSLPFLCYVAMNKIVSDCYFKYLKDNLTMIPYGVVAIFHFQLWNSNVYITFW